MTQTVKQLISDMIEREGGYVNHPSDKGGPTKYGITAIAVADYFGSRTRSPAIKVITKELAEKIYLKLYYIRPGINNLPELIRPIIFDMAVNNGPETAVQILQKELTSCGYNIGAIDGIIGGKTIGTATRAVADLGSSLINCLVNRRLNHYRKIIKNDPTQAVFEHGWVARAESFRPVAIA